MEHNNNDSRAVYKCTFCEVGFIVVLRHLRWILLEHEEELWASGTVWSCHPWLLCTVELR